MFVCVQVIGGSLLFLYDDEGKAGVWMIDFAKTLPHPELTLDHRSSWQLGNCEDGYLKGLDNLIQVSHPLCFSSKNQAADKTNIVFILTFC